MVLRKFSEIINNKPIVSQCNIFYKYPICFVNLRFDLFSIIAKKVNQIRNNVVCVVACLIFVFCCALTTGRCNAFQHIFRNKKKSEFYGPYFQTMLFLVTMVNATKIYQFKAKSSEIKDYTLCLGNISKDFTIRNCKKTGFKGSVNFSSVDFSLIDINDLSDIHRYLIKGAQYKVTFELIKKNFVGQLVS